MGFLCLTPSCYWLDFLAFLSIQSKYLKFLCMVGIVSSTSFQTPSSWVHQWILWISGSFRKPIFKNFLILFSESRETIQQNWLFFQNKSGEKPPRFVAPQGTGGFFPDFLLQCRIDVFWECLPESKTLFFGCHFCHWWSCWFWIYFINSNFHPFENNLKDKWHIAFSICSKCLWIMASGGLGSSKCWINAKRRRKLSMTRRKAIWNESDPISEWSLKTLRTNQFSKVLRVWVLHFQSLLLLPLFRVFPFTHFKWISFWLKMVINSKQAIWDFWKLADFLQRN